jgi:hypothetical protein
MTVIAELVHHMPGRARLRLRSRGDGRPLGELAAELARYSCGPSGRRETRGRPPTRRERGSSRK